MPVRPQSECCEKAAVSVSEAASLCGLSRTHFHALIKNSVMPPPCYDRTTRKPFFPREMLDACLRIRRTNVGYDGRICLFYQRRRGLAGLVPAGRASRRPRTVTTTVVPSRHAELLEGLRSLGLASVTAEQVDRALCICFPNGIGSASDGEVLRLLWQQLRRSQA